MQTGTFLANSKFGIAVPNICSCCNPFLASTVSTGGLGESRRASGGTLLCGGTGRPGWILYRIWDRWEGRFCAILKLQLCLALQYWLWISTQPFFLHMETLPILDVVTFENTAQRPQMSCSTQDWHYEPVMTKYPCEQN